MEISTPFWKRSPLSVRSIFPLSSRHSQLNFYSFPLSWHILTLTCLYTPDEKSLCPQFIPSLDLEYIYKLYYTLPLHSFRTYRKVGLEFPTPRTNRPLVSGPGRPHYSSTLLFSNENSIIPKSTLHHVYCINQRRESRTVSWDFGNIKGLTIFTIHVENRKINQKPESRTVSRRLRNLEKPTSLPENKITPLRTTLRPTADQWSFWFRTNVQTSKIGVGSRTSFPTP